MQIKPVANRVLVRFHFPPETGVVLLNPQLSASVEDKRTKVQCLEVGPDVKVCHKGDFLFLHPDAMRNVVPTNKEPAEALIDASIILGVVTDDLVLDDLSK